MVCYAGVLFYTCILQCPNHIYIYIASDKLRGSAKHVYMDETLIARNHNIQKGIGTRGMTIGVVVFLAEEGRGL